MSSAMQFYVSTLLVYAGVYIIAAWGLNLQFGLTGILSFAYILFQSIGAYLAAVFSLGPPASRADVETYAFGANLPFPLPILVAAAGGALLAAVLGPIVLRRLRSDLQAITMLVMSLIATDVISSDQSLLNGATGLSLVPAPLSTVLGLSSLQYQWFFVGMVAVICAIVYFVMNRITSSPLGRALRTVRESERSAAAIGKNVFALRMRAFIVGGAIAAVSGALLVLFIGSWAPGSWLYIETFVLFAAVIIGGSGNNLGVAIGALVVPVGSVEAVQYLPSFGPPGMIDALQWVVIGLLLLLFIWFRPTGLLPERRRYFPVSDLRNGRQAASEADR